MTVRGKNKNLLKASLYFLLVSVIEAAFAVAFYVLWGVFSMLVFGEGQNSFMYSHKNEIIFYSLVTIIPSIYNICQICKSYRRADEVKLWGFSILTVVYAFFVLSPHW